MQLKVKTTFWCQTVQKQKLKLSGIWFHCNVQCLFVPSSTRLQTPPWLFDYVDSDFWVEHNQKNLMTLSTRNTSRPEKQDQHKETRWRGAKGTRPESALPLWVTERSGGDWKPTSMYCSSLLGDYNQLCHRHQQTDTRDPEEVRGQENSVEEPEHIKSFVYTFHITAKRLSSQGLHPKVF